MFIFSISDRIKVRETKIAAHCSKTRFNSTYLSTRRVTLFDPSFRCHIPHQHSASTRYRLYKNSVTFPKFNIIGVSKLLYVILYRLNGLKIHPALLLLQLTVAFKDALLVLP